MRNFPNSHIWCWSRELCPESMIRFIRCRKDLREPRPIILCLINWKCLMQSLRSWLTNTIRDGGT